MIYFAKGRPCPYPISPCVALSRTETPLYHSTHIKDIVEREALLARLDAYVVETGCTCVVDFDGNILRGTQCT